MHSTSPRTVRVGVFQQLSQADRVVEQLLAAGFEKDEITVICPQCSPAQLEGAKHDEPAGAHTPKSAVTGGTIGAVLGGLATVIGLTATGGLALLTVGPLLLAASGGAVAGGFVGAMSTRGFEHEIANFYDQALQRGEILVAVEEHGSDAEERLALAERIFAEAGAHPIALREG